MLLFIEAALIIIIGLVYISREVKRKVKNYRTGDIIWVRENWFKPQKAILSNWDDFSFTYIPDENYELKVKSWIFLARNESYQQRQNKQELN